MFSDTPPPMVMPDTTYGREQRQKLGISGGLVALCGNFKKVSPYYLDSDTHLPVDKPCANRRIGDANHNWCLRCISGYPIGIQRR
jgi:hypothetical protein